MKKYKGYIVIKNFAGELGRYEVDINKSISHELVRVLEKEQIVLEEGDRIEFESCTDED